jgi:predicted nucleotidyltransferase component of viral defense system
MLEQRPLDAVLEHLDDIFEWILEESGIEFDLGKKEDPHENNYTFYLSYIGPLPGKAKDVKVDISFRETILQPIQELTIIKTYAEYSDFIDKATIQVYSLEEVVIEKICALHSPARNEPRDLYDIYYLTEEVGVEIDFLIDDVNKKLQFKGSSLDERRGQFDKKESRLKNLWENRLSAQMVSLPEFNDAFRAVKRTFRQAGLIDE